MELLEQRQLLAVVATGRPDYAPGETADVFASSFQPGEAVQFQVLHNDGTPNTGNGHLPWTVVDGSANDLDGKLDGNVHTTWYVDGDDSAGSSFNLTAQGSSSGLSSFTTFTDGNPAIDLQQWKNLSAIWANGQANSNQAKYLEGDVVPYWLEASNLTIGTTYGVRINLDYYQSSTDAGGFLYLDTYNDSITGVPQNPSDGTGGPLPALSTDNTFTFNDPLYANPGLAFKVYNADVISVSYSVSADGLTRFADVRFTPVAANEGDGEATVNIYWGERLALPNEVITSANPDANSKGAAGFTGGSLQTKIAGTGAAGTTWITPSNAVQLMTGVVVQGSISGYKWNDLDGQGDKDANEPGLAGWTIQLYKDDGDNVFDAGDVLVDSKITADGLTDANGDGSINALDLGFYKFAPVLRGTYFVKEVQQAGWTQTFPTNNLYGPLTISEVTSNYTDQNFGNFHSAAAINIVKSVNGDDANSAPGIYVAPGSTVTFTYVVTNTGNVAIKNVTVTDDVLGTITSFTGDANNNSLLDTNETWTYTTTATALAGQHTNVGTVTGNNNLTNAQVTANDPANYFGSAPAIDIEKFVNGQDADAATGPVLAVGSTATFTYEVKNTGNVALANVVVVDDNGTPGVPGDDFNPTFTGGDANNNSLLDLGETWTYSANRIVTAGQYTNIGKVTGQSSIGQTVTDTDPANHFGAAPAIDIEKLVNGQDADAATGPVLAVGSTATFTYQVTNTGNVALSNVVVVDDNGTPGVPGDDFNPTFTGGDANNNSLLDLGETWTYSANHIVTAGQYTNIGKVTGQSSIGQTVTDTDPANHFGAAPGIDIEKLVNGQDADAATGPVLAVGSTATFTYQVTNAGNVALSSVVVVDDNGTPGVPGDDFNPTFTGGDVNNNNLLDLGETWTYSANHIVTAGQYTNIGKVTGQSSIGQTVTDTDPANHFGAAPAIDIEKLVNGQDADAATGPILAVGSTATFTYQVTNTGNAALSSVVVVDDNGTPGIPGDDFNPTFTGGDVNNNSLLDLGETWTYSANRIVTAGQYTNIGKVTGQSSIGQTVTDTDPANHFGAAPAIDIEKLVNGQDADATTGPILAVGSTATFTYQVTNTGNVTLSNVVVVDDNGTPGVPGDDFNPTFTGGDVNNNSLLDLGETWTYSANRIVTAGQYTNIGKVTGQSSIGQTVTDTDPANHFGAAPAIDIEKLVNGQDADATTGPILAVGSTATFTYQVTNTGNVTLSNVVVVDDNGTPGVPGDDFNPTFTGGDLNNNSLLDLGETWTYSANRIVTAGQYTNIGKVTGQSSIGQTVTDTDPANHFGAAPAIDIEKLVNGQDADAATGPVLAVGSTATFTYEVKNTGNVALSNVVVVDDNGTPGVPGDDFNPTFTGGDVNNNSLLDLGETWTYSANRIVTAGQYTNIGKVTGQSSIGQTVTDTDPANHFGAAPAIDIEKLVNGQDADAATGPILAVGSTATFTYQVTNTGNVALSNVVVVDDNGTAGLPGDDFNPTFSGGDVNNNSLLDLGETWTYSANRIVTAGQYTNIGKVTGQSSIGQTVTDTDPANYFGAAPAIDIEKLVNGQDADVATGPVLTVGSTATFTYQVTNTGNVAVSNIVVVDDNGTAGVPGDDFNPTFTGGDANNNSLLDLGETWTYSANRIVTAGQYTNIGKVTGQSSIGQTVADTDPANHFGAAPAIGINKVTVDGATAGDGLTILSGEAISWRYSVTNTGNVALSGVTVNDDQAGVTPAYQSGDINNNSLLDLTETWIFTAGGTAVTGNYSNTGTANGSFTDSAQQTSKVTASDPSSYFGATPQIAIDKVTVDGANVGDGLTIDAGDAISWRYTVTNTGNVALSGVTVTDNRPGVTPLYQSGDINNNSLLDLTETWTFTAAGTAIVGNYSNLGTAKGTFTDTAGHSRTVTSTDASSYFGECEIIVIGPDKQNTATSLVKVVNKKTGQVESQFYAYEPNFKGGVRIATGDMDGDGVDEIITAPGRGRAPEIRVFKQDGTELTQFRTMAYATSFAGGVDVAVGDVNGDGKNDIVTVPTYGPTQVRVFLNNYNSANPAADPIHNSPDKQFAVFSNKFQGGADVTLADVGTFANGATVSATTPDGKSEIVVGNGPGMRSTIFVYDVTGTPTVVDTILPFDNKFRGGITLDAARINADLIPDFIVSSGNGGKSAIEIWSGLTNDGPDVRLSAFNAFTGAKTVNAPVHAVAMDTNDDGIADTIVAVQGTDGATGEIRSFSPSGVLQSKLTGFNGPWNIARLRCHEPLAAAFDQVFAQLGV